MNGYEAKHASKLSYVVILRWRRSSSSPFLTRNLTSGVLFSSLWHVLSSVAKAPDPQSFKIPLPSSSEEGGELVDPAAPAEGVAAVGAALFEGAPLAGDLGAVHAHPHVLGVILKEIGGGLMMGV